MVSRVTRYFLEIRDFSKTVDLNLPENFQIILDDKDNFHLNRFFYKQIGVDHHWRDRLLWSDSEWVKYVTNKNLEKFSGVRKFKYGIAEKENAIGQVTGLAWTEVGGELLTIEASHVDGKGRIIKTGSLGDVMQESIQAAFTVVRSRAKSLGIKSDFYEKFDVHIHVPEGATPKDGPSAGGAMAISLISIFTGIPVKCDTAMTGEITLRGQILKIGGLKEKLLAAKRGGIKNVIIPKENEPDLQEIPDQILKSLNIIPVEWIDEVISHALIKEPIPVLKSSSANKNKSQKSKQSKTENNQAH